MGRTTFICRCDTVEDLEAALADVAAHNATACERLGPRTKAEMASLDPMRSTLFSMLPAGGSSSLSERWTRGGPIDGNYALVKWKERLWLEASNDQAGAASTEWFERRRNSGLTRVWWYGSRGKPSGYAPSAGEAHSVFEGNAAALRAIHAANRVSGVHSLQSERVDTGQSCDDAPISDAQKAAAFKQVIGAISGMDVFRDMDFGRFGARMVNAGALPRAALRTGKCGACGAVGTEATPLLLCSKCEVAQYCNARCQRAHFRTHKAECIAVEQ